MKIQVLVSAVNKQPDVLVEDMNIKNDAIIINQCDTYGYTEFLHCDHKIQWFSMKERGVGLSRNTALMRTDAEIAIFSDEDIVYYERLEERISEAFAEYPKADILLFNIKVDERRRTYYNTTKHRVRWYNYGRYPAYAIAFRVESLRKANVSFSLLFGGGAKYSNGEDSLFLRDCLKKKLRIYAHTTLLGQEMYRESTWFTGYHEKFFVDRGVLYHYLYGAMAFVFALRFLYVNQEKMLKEIPFWKAYGMMMRGIRQAKK